MNISDLFNEIMKPIVAHYKAGPPSPERCFEVLSALAAATALVIEGTDEDPTALMYFHDTLKLCLQKPSLADNVIPEPGA